MKNKPFYAAATTAAAFLITFSSMGAAHAQNGETGKNAPPRPDSTTPVPAKPNFTFGSASKPGTIFAEVWEGKVVEVLDGVTLRVERRSRSAKANESDGGPRSAGTDGGKPDSILVRLWGVSLPANPTDAASAKAYVEKSVKDKTVRVQVESKSAKGEPIAEVFLLPDTPRYGVPVGRIRNASDPISVSQPRTIAEPDVPATFPNLNEGLLRAGLVRWNQTAAPKADGLSGAQEAAQKDKVGVWAVPGQK